MRNTLLRGVVLASALAAVGCSPSSTPATGEASGGAGGTGGSSSKSATSSKASTGGSKATSKTGKGGNSAATGNEGGASDGGEGATEGGESSGGAASSSKSGSAKGGTSSKSGSGSANGGSKTSGSVSSNGGATTEGGASSTATEGGSTGVEPTGVAVRLDKTHQTIQGFGLNSALMKDDKTIPIDKIYSTEGTDGIGLSILRVGMKSDGTLTGKYVSEAKAKGAKVIGSTWTPPADCKSNKSEKDGGYLLQTDACYSSWATKIVNFAKAQGLYAMSIANESDFASCPGVPVCTDSYETTTYTAKQMVAWVKYVGPKLKEAGIKVIAPEASEWIHAWSNLSSTGSIVASYPNSSDPHKCGCFSNTITKEEEAKCAQKCLDGDGYDYGHWLWKDQEAWKAFDILGVHEYDSQIAYAWPADVNDGKRDKEVWQTEMSGVMHWPEQGPTTHIENGVAVAGWIHSALTVGEASAWLYWWWEAYYKDDNEGLALIQGSSTYAKRFYTLGNYSKFVRPGYIAVEVTGNSNADVLLSGYKSEDGKTVVIVAINKGKSAATVPIGFAGGTAPASCTPNVTSASDNLKAGTAVAIADGKLSASLAATTVTTFVCK